MAGKGDRTRLTDAGVKALRCPKGKSELSMWDDLVPGLMVRVRPQSDDNSNSTPARAFYVLYYHDGERKRLKLGTYGVMAVADARKAAKQALSLVADGKDPAGIKQEEAGAKRVSDLIDRLKTDFLPTKRPSSRRHSPAMHSKNKHKGRQ